MGVSNIPDSLATLAQSKPPVTEPIANVTLLIVFIFVFCFGYVTCCA